MFKDGMYRIVKLEVSKRNRRNQVVVRAWFSDDAKERWAEFGVGDTLSTALFAAVEKFSMMRGIDPSRMKIVFDMPDAFADFGAKKLAREASKRRDVGKTSLHRRD